MKERGKKEKGVCTGRTFAHYMVCLLENSCFEICNLSHVSRILVIMLNSGHVNVLKACTVIEPGKEDCHLIGVRWEGKRDNYFDPHLHQQLTVGGRLLNIKTDSQQAQVVSSRSK